MLTHIRAIALLAALVCGSMLAGTQAFASETLRNARLSVDLRTTHLVLGLSGRVRFASTTLQHPDRLVIDLIDTRNTADFSRLSLRDGPIRRIRTGIRKGDDLRIVLDLRGPVAASLRLGADHNLLVDLRDRGNRKASVVAVKEAPPRPVMSALKGRRDVVVTIDAGHGGHDSGAIGPHRYMEKNVTLAIARDVATILRRERGYKVVLTRSTDTFIPLKKRAEIARRAQADLFVSIHADSYTSPDARGSSVFALSDRGASSTMAAFLARQNGSESIGGVSTHGKDDDLVKVLADLSLNSSMDASMRVGGDVLDSVSRIARLHSRRVEQAGFMVLKSPDTPSILVETGFISNPHEERLLISRAYQHKLARAIFSGINRYFTTNPPPNTYLAWVKRNRSSQQARAETDDELAAVGRP